MTPATFQRLRAEERHLREVIVATRQCERMRRARPRVARTAWRVARAWAVVGDGVRLAERLHVSRQIVFWWLAQLQIPVRSAHLTPRSRRLADLEPKWRACKRCKAVIAWHHGFRASQYALRTYCDDCSRSVFVQVPHYHRQTFTDEEAVAALRATGSIIRAAQRLHVTRGALLGRMGSLYVRQLLGVEEENDA